MAWLYWAAMFLIFLVPFIYNTTPPPMAARPIAHKHTQEQKYHFHLLKPQFPLLFQTRCLPKAMSIPIFCFSLLFYIGKINPACRQRPCWHLLYPIFLSLSKVGIFFIKTNICFVFLEIIFRGFFHASRFGVALQFTALSLVVRTGYKGWNLLHIGWKDTAYIWQRQSEPLP